MYDLGRLRLIGGVGGDEFLFHRRFERVVEGVVDAMDGGAGKSMALTGAWFCSTVLLQRVIQFSYTFSTAASAG